jgi:hypothetical protein
MTGIIWLYIGLNTLASRADRHATDGRGDGWAEESRDEHKDRDHLLTPAPPPRLQVGRNLRSRYRTHQHLSVKRCRGVGVVLLGGWQRMPKCERRSCVRHHTPV